LKESRGGMGGGKTVDTAKIIADHVPGNRHS
jgi:glycerol dehydrogenase-like iron-containing ADH family enzyme